jgi:hypothetical protein
MLGMERTALLSVAALLGLFSEASCFSPQVPVTRLPGKSIGISTPRYIAPKSPQMVPGHRRRVADTSLNLSTELIFQIDNVITLPFWALMLLAPKSRITRQVMSSYFPLLPLIFVYSESFFSLFLQVVYWCSVFLRHNPVDFFPHSTSLS